jgi:hypothetical protein
MRCIVTLACVASLLAAAAAPLPAGETPLKPVNLGPTVNSKGDETDPFVSANGLLLLYASNAAGTFDIMYSRRSSTSGKWAAAKPVADLHSKDADERSPFVLPNGRLYFATNAVPDEKLKDLKNFDIYERSGELAATPLLQVSTPEDEMFPWVALGGKEFYFSRKTKDGWRLFLSKGPYYGGISKGKRIAELPVGFHHATLSTDGKTMYLQGPLAGERWGLFRTTRTKIGGKWAEPEPLAALNSPEGARGDLAPCLAQGGTILYFASDRPGGQGGLDLWSIPTARLKAKKK